MIIFSVLRLPQTVAAIQFTAPPPYVIPLDRVGRCEFAVRNAVGAVIGGRSAVEEEVLAVRCHRSVLDCYVPRVRCVVVFSWSPGSPRSLGARGTGSCRCRRRCDMFGLVCSPGPLARTHAVDLPRAANATTRRRRRRRVVGRTSDRPGRRPVGQAGSSVCVGECRWRGADSCYARCRQTAASTRYGLHQSVLLLMLARRRIIDLSVVQ